MRKVINDNCGGIAIALLWSIVFFIIVLSCVFVIDIYYAHVKSEIAKDAVTMSALSVYKNIDVAQLESGQVILGEQAVKTFRNYLSRNMKLTDDLVALPGSAAVGQVEIDKFILYNPDSTETTYPDGTEINYKPSLYVRIKFDVEPILKGIVGSKKTVYTSAVADLIPEN